MGHSHPHGDSVDIAIVGAGVSGLAAAEALRTFAPEATLRLLEQNPVPGGRLASRQGEFQLLDTTAQFFTARSPEFKILVEHWEKQGWVKPWFHKPDEKGFPEPGYASALGMGRLMAHWAVRHDVRCGVRVEALEAHSESWQLRLAPSIFAAPHDLTARAVLVTAPWPQARNLVQGHLAGDALSPDTQISLNAIRYAPCLVLEVEWNGGSESRVSGLEFMPSPEIVCVAEQRSKGLPGNGNGLVILMTPEFSEAHWNKVDSDLLALLAERAQPWVSRVASPKLSLGRWPHARVMQAFGKPFLDCGATSPLYIAGDGFAGARVEGAFVSGWEAGKALAAGMKSVAAKT